MYPHIQTHTVLHNSSRSCTIHQCLAQFINGIICQCLVQFINIINSCTTPQWDYPSMSMSCTTHQWCYSSMSCTTHQCLAQLINGVTHQCLAQLINGITHQCLAQLINGVTHQCLAQLINVSHNSSMSRTTRQCLAQLINGITHQCLAQFMNVINALGNPSTLSMSCSTHQWDHPSVSSMPCPTHQCLAQLINIVKVSCNSSMSCTAHQHLENSPTSQDINIFVLTSDEDINILHNSSMSGVCVSVCVRACVHACVWGIIYCLDLICYFINAAYNLYVVVDWVFRF